MSTEIEKQNSEIKVAKIGAFVAVAIAFLSFASQGVFSYLDHAAQRKHDLLEHRRQALFRALQVIDNVYANSGWVDLPAPKKFEWDLTEARDAMNEMIVYCKEPNRTVPLFMRAVGTRNPGEPTKAITPQHLKEFREQVSKELELPVVNYEEQDKLWIATLPGGK